MGGHDAREGKARALRPDDGGLFARGDQALAPWAMAFPFGVGQMLSAAVLYWTLERTDGRPQP